MKPNRKIKKPSLNEYQIIRDNKILSDLTEFFNNEMDIESQLMEGCISVDNYALIHTEENIIQLSFNRETKPTLSAIMTQSILEFLLNNEDYKLVIYEEYWITPSENYEGVYKINRGSDKN